MNQEGIGGVKQEIADLWKVSFGDSDEYIRLYFDRVYKEEHTLTIRENGRVISAVQMLPYEMTYCGTTVPIAYVCGACTLPSERGKGRMNRLMRQAIQVMRDRHYALTTLIPASAWLFNFYERFGYATAFDYSLQTYRRSVMPHAPSCGKMVSCQDVSPDMGYAYFDRKQRERACAVLHTACDWNIILQDCLNAHGGAWVALRNGLPEGLAIAVPTDRNTVYIKELFCDRPDVKESLIRHILTHFHRQTAQLRLPPTPSDARPYGMAHILDLQRITDLYRSFHHPTETSVPKDPDNRSLTQTLLHYEQQQGWMNLMLD
jgi:predicted acetyltransferase